MPLLIRRVESEILPNIIDEVNYVNSVIGDIQREDYINLIGFTAYLQNMTRMEVTSLLQTPINFGLNNTVPSVTLEISY